MFPEAKHASRSTYRQRYFLSQSNALAKLILLSSVSAWSTSRNGNSKSCMQQICSLAQVKQLCALILKVSGSNLATSGRFTTILK